MAEETEKGVKMYFKGDSGIKEPVDIDGNPIVEGDVLSRDYGDNEKYGIITEANYPTTPFYKVKINSRGGFFAESIEPCGGLLGNDNHYFLHDFRFKHCKIIKKDE